jgi:predicted O-methyltransferase YrrM
MTKSSNTSGMMHFHPTWSELVAEYENNAETNDRIHDQLEQATRRNSLLAGHRRHIEENQLGFGDAAFHAMWACLLEHGVALHGGVRALEIGVFKGQVISLWSLLAKQYNWPVRVSCITPMAGHPRPRSRLANRLWHMLSRKYREEMANSNFYEQEDYRGIVHRLFAHFGLDFGEVDLLRGYSTDPDVLQTTVDRKYEIVYVDGDHTFEGASHDFAAYGPKVVKGGWLIADDAGCDLPGTTFWKGHEAVSRAVQTVPSLGFRNVLNVGHNRVYERVL